MTYQDLLKYRKIPRNDFLLFLYEESGITNIYDLHERLNKPNKILKLILDDLLHHKLITVDNVHNLNAFPGSYLDNSFKKNLVKLTEKGKDFTESKIVGLNFSKYLIGDPIEDLRIKSPNASINFEAHYNLSFEEFCDKGLAGKVQMDKYELYYILSGRTYKNDKDKKIFISYAHDELGENKEWVNSLAKELSKIFYVEYDANLTISMNPFDYMKQNIISSDFVVIVFNPLYLYKYKNIKSSGVNYEFSVIENELFKKVGRSKYIAILKEGEKDVSIPSIMSNTVYCDFRKSERFESELENLINLIKN